MGKISLPDFFKYFSGTAEQLEAVVLLEASMPDSLLKDDSAWVIKYREAEAPPAPPAGAWRSPRSRWRTSCSALNQACLTASWTTSPAAWLTARWTSWKWFFLGCGHESCGPGYQLRLTVVTMRAAKTWAIPNPATAFCTPEPMDTSPEPV